MHWIIGLTAAIAAAPLCAQGVAVDSAVYVERANGGAVQIEPATELTRGDRVVTILTWDATGAGSYTITSPVPAGLTLRSASRPDLEISTDRGRTWRKLADPDAIPTGTTHLRWKAGAGGRLSYRGIVR